MVDTFLTTCASCLQAEKFLEENKLEFLAGAEAADEARALSPADAQAKLLQLMNNDENCECIRGWVKVRVPHVAADACMLKAVFVN